ncbi:MAG TPA: hypothetical protein VLA56_19545 [Pseudomonadales bacterium]|nr:hypothetical protein [Pseudomonadales bacterium]
MTDADPDSFASRADRWLEPLQRVVVMTAIVAGGVLFVRHEEDAARLNVDATWHAFARCTATVSLEIENAGEASVSIDHVLVTLVRPDRDTPRDGRLALIADPGVRRLRGGERVSLYYQFIDAIPADAPFLRFMTTIRTKEEDSKWTRFTQYAFPVPDSCDSGSSPPS